MALLRIRSPNYPAVGLPEAVEKIGLIHEREQHLAAPREVMAKHLGYGGMNGSSIKMLSALLKFGLLEKTADDRRKVTSLALDILHPRERADRIAALRTAAFRPKLFAEIANEWQNGVPSDENLKSYLLRLKFAADAIPEAIRAYRETMEYLTQEGAAGDLASVASDTYTAKVASGQESQMEAAARPQGRGPRAHQVSASLATGSAVHVDTQVIRGMPTPSISRATLPLSEGTVALELPDRLSPESLEDLRDWMETMLRRAERVAERTQRAGALADPTSEPN